MKTPKEKAEELFAKYVFLTISDMSDENFNQTKQCALVAVDEMLGLGAIVGSDLSDLFYIYWEEVKQEIKNL
jgi:hypothetical protein